MKKYIVITLIISLSYISANSQCTIFSFAANGQSPANDTLVICAGDAVDFTSSGSCGVLMSNDFNGQTLGTGWSSQCNPQFNNPCDPSPNTPPDPYLWVGSSVTQPRRLTTNPYVVTTACQVCFDMDYATQSDPSPCEGPDQSNEGVHLQYSTNGGATWTDINYWDPGTGYVPQLIAWDNYCESVPINGNNVQFSWYQDVGSGSGYDHWGLDNVEITCPMSTGVVWSHGPTVENPPTINPIVSNWYTVTYIDTASGAFTSDSIYIKTLQFPSATFSSTSPICVNGSSSVNYTGTGTSTSNYTWDFGTGTAVPGTGQGPHTISWAAIGTYDIILSVDNGGCASPPDTVRVVVNPLATAVISGNPTICGGNAALQVDFTGTGPWDFVYTDGVSNITVNNINSTPYTLVVSPTAPTTYTLVSVSDSDCGAGTVSGQADVVFYPLPTATISGSQSICDGDNADLTFDFTGTGPWDFSYSDGTNTYTETGINNSPYTVNLGSLGISNTTYTLSDINDVNCVGASLIGYAQIEVHQIPTADFTLSALNCFGDNSDVLYTGTATSAGTYSWNFNGGDANPGVGQGPHLANWSTNGPQSVSLQVIENGCTSTIVSQQVTNPDDIVLVINGQGLLCNGDGTGEITINAMGGTVSGDYNYTWNVSGNTNHIENLDAGIYHVTVTDDNSCVEIQNITIEEPNVLVVQTPVDLYLCNGRSTIITADVTGGTTPFFYDWDGQAGGGTFTDTPTEDNSYTVIVTDVNGCSDTSSTNVFVSEPVSMQLISNKDTLCPGDNAIITAIINSSAGGPYTLSLLNGTLVSTPFEISTDTTDLVIVNILDGCGSEDADTIEFNFHPVPEIDFSPNLFNGCQPLVVKFNQNTPYIDGQTYLWDFDNNQQDNVSDEYSPEHTFKESGMFDVSLTITSDKNCKTRKTVSNLINVYEKPIADFIAEPEVVSLIKPEIFFENLSTSTDTCYWNFGSGDTSNAVNPVHYFTESGEIDVELLITTFQGCKDTVMEKIIVEDPITFYAPTAFSPDGDGINDVFKIYGTGINKDNFELYIFDRFGEIIYFTDNIKEGWNGKSKNGSLESQTGTYTWLCSYKDIQDNDRKQTGNVILLK